MYTFENICLEDPSIKLGDETTKVFLNAASEAKDIPPQLKEFFDYMLTQKPTGSLTERIDKNVRSVATNEKWRLEYMTLEMKIREEREDAFEEGCEEGAIKKEKQLVEQMLKDGKTPIEIHDFCHITLELIKSVQEELQHA